MKFWNKIEKDVFKQLKIQRFILTPTYDPALLHATGMDAEFEIIFRTVGWENVWQIDEPRSKLLTLEFLCTLQPTDSEVTFRLFGKDFSILGSSLVSF
jgi:predicted double-glycine peptidase